MTFYLYGLFAFNIVMVYDVAFWAFPCKARQIIPIFRINHGSSFQVAGVRRPTWTATYPVPGAGSEGGSVSAGEAAAPAHGGYHGARIDLSS